MRRRLDLCNAKEVAAQNNGRYTDRVTELLRQAMDRLGEEFLEQLARADDALRHFKTDLERIEHEYTRHTYERSQAALRRELDQERPSTWEEPSQDGGAPEAIGGPELRP